MTLLRVVKVKRHREIKTELGYGVAAAIYGPTRLATRSRQRDALDKLIASQALALGVTLVTNNVSDFVACPALKEESWAGGIETTNN
jgi:tRNA(fMet)-specific endonuclease VapC